MECYVFRSGIRFVFCDCLPFYLKKYYFFFIIISCNLSYVYINLSGYTAKSRQASWFVKNAWTHLKHKMKHNILFLKVSLVFEDDQIEQDF